MSVYLVYISFVIFVVILLVVGIYFILALRKRRVLLEKINKQTETIKEILNNHMGYSDIKLIPEYEIEEIRKIVSNKIGLEAFINCFQDYLEDNGDLVKVRDYAALVVSYKTLLNNKIVREKYKKSYILYLLSEFRINTDEVMEFALESLDSDSIYIRNNSLRVIRNTGNVPIVMKAIESISSQNHYYNYRVLVDFIDNFTGEQELLNQALVEKFPIFNNRFKRLIIEHFSNKLNDNENIRLLVLDVLSSSNDKNTLIMATRYFGRVIDERAEEYILQNLESPDWELRAISAKIISHYNSQSSRFKIREGLKDKNYYVRYNSAFSYIDMEEEENILKYLDNITDPFAKDITLYAMYNSNIIDYKEYAEMAEKVEKELSLHVG